MSPAQQRRRTDPAADVVIPTVTPDDAEPGATEPLMVADRAPLVVPPRYAIPSHTRVAEIPARILRARDIARAVRAEVVETVDVHDDPAIVELATRVVALANCVEALCEVIA